MIWSWYYALVQYLYKKRRAKRLAAAAKRRNKVKAKFQCVKTEKYTVTVGHKDLGYVMIVGYYENGFGERKFDVISCNYPNRVDADRVRESQLTDAERWAALGKSR